MSNRTIRFLVILGAVALATVIALHVFGFDITLSPLFARADQQPAPSRAAINAVPSQLSYQGFLSDGDGTPHDGVHTMTFAVYETTTGGAPLWNETQSEVVVRSGYFSVLLGNTTPFPAGLFDLPERYLGVTVDANQEMVPRQPFASVAYALHADQAEQANQAPWAGLTEVPASFADGVDDDTTYTAGQGLILYGTEFSVESAWEPGFLVTTLDSAGDVGQHTSIVVGVDGLGLISYYDVTNGDLKVAHCEDVACTTATITTLDSAGDVGQYNAIAVGTDWYGLISYYDATNGNLKVAHCEDLACTAATITTLDSSGQVDPEHTSIAIQTNGLGLISYSNDQPFDGVRLAYCSDLACTSAPEAILDTGTVEDTAITIGADGKPLIAYEGAGIWVAHCEDKECNSFTLTQVEEYASGLRSIAVGEDGLGLITYGGNNYLQVAHCDNVACTSVGTSPIVLNARYYGNVEHSSIATGADGLGVMSFYDAANGDLKVVHCPNASCTPYFHPEGKEWPASLSSSSLSPSEACITIVGSAPSYDENPPGAYVPGQAACPAGYQVIDCSYVPDCSGDYSCYTQSSDATNFDHILFDFAGNSCTSYGDVGTVLETQARCCPINP